LATRTPIRPATVASRSTARAQVALSAVTPLLRPQFQFNQAYTQSPVQAQKITAGLLTANRPSADRLTDAGELVHAVSAGGDQQRRRTLIAGFRQAKCELALVHQMALLPEEQAEAFISDYLKEGGGLGAVFQWLGMAGAALRAPRSRAARVAATRHWVEPKARSARSASRGLFGDIVGAVGGAINAVGNAIGSAVNSVVNAVIKAGKSLADAI
jgi:hypothetical protein